MTKRFILVGALLLCVFLLVGCDDTASRKDIKLTLTAADILQARQPTPTDIEYSTIRYSLIRRVYWQNGMYEKASSLPRPVSMPLGYIICYAGNKIASYSAVDGPLVSLTNYLTPISEDYESSENYNEWLADVDGTYGDNTEGVFWFTPGGHYNSTTNEHSYYDNFPEFELALSLYGVEYKEIK